MIRLKLENTIIKINKKNFLLIEKLLTNLTNDSFEIVEPYGKSLWYQGETNELYLKSYPFYTLVISRISFDHQRLGLGTRLLNELLVVAKNYGFKSIMIESTQTHAINAFCDRHGFEKIEQQGFFLDGEFFGNYKRAI